MKRPMTGAALAALMFAVSTLAGCSEQGASAPTPPPAPAWPSPPSPDLPLTGAKARQIVGDLPLSCVELASLKVDMLICAERQRKPADHEALRTELRDLRWNLQQQPREAAQAQCTALQNEVRAQPKPTICYDLGIS